MNSFQLLTSILFPNHCLCCGEISAIPLCLHCIDCLPHRKRWPCPKCQEKTTPFGAVCSGCYGTTPLDGVFSASHYSFPLKNSARGQASFSPHIPSFHTLVPRIVTAYKYGFVRSLHKPLSIFLLDALLKNNLPLPDLILAVPLHPRRLRWRGFNQSELLAQEIARDLLPHLPLETPALLVRKKYTLPQVKTKDQKMRRQNLKNAFLFSGDPAIISGKRVWLIDDVATTNTTLTECARVLKKKGAKEVWGIVVAS